MIKRILAFTSIRSDYDLMSPLYRLLHDDPEFDLRLIVSGAHLSTTYGHTVNLIEKDRYPILQRIETLLDSDTRESRVKSAGLLLQGAVEPVVHFRPDIIVYAGDREDTLIASAIAGYLEIPSIHFYGGDHATDGYIDNPVRHAISKLSTMHMVTLPEHRDRLVLMGEAPERIHIIGNMSLDNFVHHVPEPWERILERLELGGSCSSAALVIFHPTSEEAGCSGAIFENILLALKEEGIFGFVSFPNVDPGNRDIIAVCDRYRSDQNFYFYRSLPRDIFISLYKGCRLIIGNSSSGIMESASVPVPAINVGLRQRGRFAPDNVVFCDGDYASISNSVRLVLAEEFLSMIQRIRNPYGNGESAMRALEILRQENFRPLLGKIEDPLKMPRSGGKR